MIQAKYFLSRNSIESSDIKYIVREDGRTSVYLKNGKLIKTYIPVKSFLDFLPKEEFININKGILLAKSYVIRVKKCEYTTADGHKFEGRHRALKEHLKNEIELSLPGKFPALGNPESIGTRFSILNKLPIAFCVIELVTDKEGSLSDFIFRYCNERMAILENRPLENMAGLSVSELYAIKGKPRFQRYADVAVNGSDDVVHDYIPELDKNLDIYCFQPEKGYCAMALIEE